MFTNPKINFSKKFQELPNCLEVDETFKILGIIRNTPKTLVKFQKFRWYFENNHNILKADNP